MHSRKAEISLIPPSCPVPRCREVPGVKRQAGISVDARSVPHSFLEVLPVAKQRHAIINAFLMTSAVFLLGSISVWGASINLRAVTAGATALRRWSAMRKLAVVQMVCMAISLHCSIASASAAKNRKVGLCKQSEIEVFFCQTRTQGKTISLCEGKVDTRRYLQYRFGTPKKLDFEYPLKPQSPAHSFKYFQQSWTKATTTAIAFSNGGYLYSLFRTMSVYGYNGAGLLVTKGNKILSDVMCREHSIRTDNISPGVWWHLSKLSIPISRHDIAFIGPEPGSRPVVCGDIDSHVSVLKLSNRRTLRITNMRCRRMEARETSGPHG